MLAVWRATESAEISTSTAKIEVKNTYRTEFQSISHKTRIHVRYNR